jgi:hypothetical protein
MKSFKEFSTPADRDDGMKAAIGKLPSALGCVFRATWESIQRVHVEQGSGNGHGRSDLGKEAESGLHFR